MANHRDAQKEAVSAAESTPIFDYMNDEMNFPNVEEVIAGADEILHKGWMDWGMDLGDNELEELEEA